MSTAADIRAATRGLGIDRLRPDQRRAVDAVVQGRDTMAVLPTGSGKSAIYQVAGSVRPGPTVVVSPLISLQEDQRRALEDSELEAAVVLHSLLGAAERDATFAAIAAGEVEYVLLAPEQLATDGTADRLAAAEPGLVVVDEAHLVTSWGEGFRPAFLALGTAVEQLGRPPLLAMTASASPLTREEVAARLRMVDPVEVVAGVERPNLHLGVDVLASRDEVLPALRDRLAEVDGAALVYVARRADAEEVAAALDEPERPALAYHGGQSRRTREAVHERFLGEELSVVVATSAFGLGIDKPDVRAVVHAEPPESIDAWYQEAGRAGRDGAPATGRLLHVPGERSRRAFQAGVGSSSPDAAGRLLEALRSFDGPVPLEVVGRWTRTGRARTVRALHELDAVGALDISADGILAARDGPSPAEVAERLEARADARRQRRTSSVRALDQLLEGSACLWQSIAGFLGDPRAERCGHCDRCDSGSHATAEGAAADDRYAPGRTLRHRTFGDGTVIERHDDVVTVDFGEAGFRSLAVGALKDGGLLA